MRPARPVEANVLARLAADLDSPSFDVREKASLQLEKLAEMAEPTLRVAAKSSSAEARGRANRLLKKLAGFHRTGLEMRPLRAVELLDRLETEAAQTLLKELSRGAPDAALTKDAAAALQRAKTRRLHAESKLGSARR